MDIMLSCDYDFPSEVRDQVRDQWYLYGISANE